MAIDPATVTTLAPIVGAGVASGWALLYRTFGRTARTLRRARARIEVLERYARLARRLLDADGRPEAEYAYPPALAYLAGGLDPDDTGGEL